MKLLFLTTQYPYPPTSGGVIKSWRLLKAFSEHYEVGLISALRGNVPQKQEELKEKINLTEIISNDNVIERSPLNFIKSIFRKKTLNEFRACKPELELSIKEIIHKYDVIFVDHYEVFQYIPKEFKGKIILHEHNAEYINWLRFAELERNPIKKILVKFEANRIKKAEQACCKRADLIFAAPNDLNYLKMLVQEPKKFQSTYHLGNDEMLSYPQLEFDSSHKSLLFVGTLTWEANLDGLIWFIEKIWPHITIRDENIKFYIVGSNPPAALINATKNISNVVLTGFVDNLETYFRKSRVFVVPLRFGSGMKVKVLDAMYRGIPCVTTPIGAEGLEARHKHELLITDKPSEYANYVLSLLEDQNEWEQLSCRSRNLARLQYTWDELIANHLRSIDQLHADLKASNSFSRVNS